MARTSSARAELIDTAERLFAERGIAAVSLREIGADIALDLRTVDDAIHRDLHQALLDWKVLFFRDQDLTVEQHRDFGARWGELEIHPFLPEGDVPEVVRFEKSDTSKG